MTILPNSRHEPQSAANSGIPRGLRIFVAQCGDSKFVMRSAVFLTFLLLLATAFRGGWTRQSTDFPNYYTAAVLVRQHQLQHADQRSALRNYYDWTWFARQMNYAGNGTQLGAYAAQTPLTMLPIVPLAGFPPQRAKQIWLVCNLVFLGLSVWLLSQVTRFSFETVWLLAFCGYFSLRTNFLYGQYYIFLLFLLTLAFYFLHHQRGLLGGVVTGIAFALKLYGGPFLLYFAAKRQWKALLGMIAATVVLAGVALLLFGWADLHYYATQILPRSLEGNSIDPYDLGSPTLSTLLRRSFMAEPELNPHPLWQAPGLFFFLRSFVSLAIAAFLVLGTSVKSVSDRRHFAWFVIAVVLLSTSTASYTFIILLLPTVLLLEDAGPRERIFLMLSYVLLTLPLRPAWWFPKVWLLFGLFFVVGHPSLREIPRRFAFAAAVSAGLLAFVDCRQHLRSYADEPGQHFARVAVQPGAAFSSYPVVTPAGLLYQSMGNNGYVLRWLHDHRNEELSFDGDALHPRLAPDGESIQFELVANGASTMMRFDPSTGTIAAQAGPVPDDSAELVISPDKKWAASTSSETGATQIWLRNLSSGKARQLTGGNCNSSAPAWELDSKSIVFASDCSRALGLPALYLAAVPASDN
jgi:hypothetical protein